MRETRAGNEQMGRIRMIDRRQQCDRCKIDQVSHALLRQRGEGRSGGQRLLRQLQRRFRAAQDKGLPIGIKRGDTAPAILRELDQRTDHRLAISLAPSTVRGSCHGLADCNAAGSIASGMS